MPGALLRASGSPTGCGAALEPYRVWSGPWPWMLFVYEVLEDQELIVVVTVRDARSSESPTMPGSRP